MRLDDARGWRSALLGAVGILGVALVTFACFWLQAETTVAALLYLLVILLVSLVAPAAPALVVGVVAIVCLDYFFTPPLFEVRFSQPLDLVVLFVFSVTALVVTHLMNRMRASFRKIEADIEERKRV